MAKEMKLQVTDGGRRLNGEIRLALNSDRVNLRTEPGRDTRVSLFNGPITRRYLVDEFDDL